MRAVALVTGVLAGLLLASPVAVEAQQNRNPARPAAPPAKKEEPPPPPAPEPPAPPYEKDLLRLAEVLGSLAFLRSLCGAEDAAEWPKRMEALLEAEGSTPSRRERIAGAYNRGFRSFALTYRVCTPSAIEATNLYFDEGEQISRNLATRFGG